MIFYPSLAKIKPFLAHDGVGGPTSWRRLPGSRAKRIPRSAQPKTVMHLPIAGRLTMETDGGIRTPVLSVSDIFLRSILRSDKILVQTSAILRKAVRMLND